MSNVIKCSACSNPFSAHRLPKLLSCSCAPICLQCIILACTNERRTGCICKHCKKETIFNDQEEGAASLITNYHVLSAGAIAKHTASGARSPARRYSPKRQAENSANEQQADQGQQQQQQNAFCTAPGCESPAAGQCEGCFGAALCLFCHVKHIGALPLPVQGRHQLKKEEDQMSSSPTKATSSSSSSTAMCARHGLPRQLWCNKCGGGALCATCAQADHRNSDCDVVELSKGVAEQLRPRLEEREAQLRVLYQTALSGAVRVSEQLEGLERNTENNITQMFENAAACVERTFSAALELQRQAFAREVQLQTGLQSLAREAGSFANEANEIAKLLTLAEQDPLKVAQHAPTDLDSVKTVIPDGSTAEPVHLRFDCTIDQRRFFEQHFPDRDAASAKGATQKNKEAQEEKQKSPMQRQEEQRRLPKVDASVIIRSGDQQGEGSNQFNGIANLAVLPNGDLIAADMRNHRLQIIRGADGTFLGNVPLFVDNNQPAAPMLPSSSTSSLSPSPPPPHHYHHHHHHHSSPSAPAAAAAAAAAAVAQSTQPSKVAPSVVCVLRNGLVLALDPETRVGCFVDPIQQQQLVRSWRFPAAWGRPVAAALLPSGEVAVLDEERSLISVLSASELLQQQGGAEPVRELDGVVATVFKNADEFVTEEQYVREKTREMRRRMMESRRLKGGVDDDDSPLDGSQRQQQQHQNSPSSSSSSPAAKRFRVFHATGSVADEDMIHRISSPTAMSEAFILRKANIPLFALSPGADTEHDTSHIYPTQKGADIAEDSRCLVAVCGASAVHLLDPFSGAHVRFLGGDASSPRAYSKPLGVAVARADGERACIVDGASNSLFVCRTRDGRMLQRIHIMPPQQQRTDGLRSFTMSSPYPQHAVCTVTGRIVVSDQVAHSVDFLSVFL